MYHMTTTSLRATHPILLRADRAAMASASLHGVSRDGETLESSPDAIDRHHARGVVAAILSVATTEGDLLAVDLSRLPDVEPRALLDWLRRQPSPAPVALAGRLPADAALDLLPESLRRMWGLS